ncbi:MAG: heme-copper oxidase subunit III [Candidatus Nanopelagicales bacterium]
MATSTVVTAAHPGAHTVHPNKTAVGTIIWLSSELMFFAGLFAMYFTLRATNQEVWAEETQLLNVPFSTVNTLILVSSSVTCQLGVLAAERGEIRGMRRWYMITFVLGSIFIAGQVYEYANLIMNEGLTLSSSAFGSAFYLTTGFHGLHVTGGLVAFLFVLARSYASRRYGHEQATAAIVTSYYWHFVDVVWIALFFMIYVLQ